MLRAIQNDPTWLQMLSVQPQYRVQCSLIDCLLVLFFFLFLCCLFFSDYLCFLCPATIWGNPAVHSNQSLLLPWSNHTANGGHWQRRGMKRGPISSLTTDFIPRVKGLISVTFTWFKSLTQLNQKSMKSLRYIFGLSCQHFKLNTVCFFYDTCRATKKGGKKGWKMARHRQGWNLTTHWKISPIAVMGLCRNGKYTRKIQKNLKLKTTTHTYQDIVGY